MVVVTSGSPYIDVDAYASIIAYAYLLNLKEIPAKAVSLSKMNESITNSLLNLEVTLDKYTGKKEDSYILVDVSDKLCFDKMVDEDKVIKVIDHHVGFEEYWQNKLGKGAKIEFIGAVATLIFEEYEKEKCLDKMPKDIAYLLMAAILDNTLNFQARITTVRDKMAYESLKKIVRLQGDFAKTYFLECQQNIEKDLKGALENDTKVEVTQLATTLPKVFAQLAVWDKESILGKEVIIKDTLDAKGAE